METLLEPIVQSPAFPRHLRDLNRIWQEEREKREHFYAFITEEMKAEFIQGEIVMHSPARLGHIQVSMNIYRLLADYVEVRGLGTTLCEKALCVFERNDYEPDVSYFSVKKSALFTPQQMKFPAPDLVVEVLSESTEARDRGVKFQDYQNGGVGEYWIVDPEAGSVEQYVSRAGRFEPAFRGAQGVLASAVVSGFAVDVREFFDAAVRRSESARLAL